MTDPFLAEIRIFGGNFAPTGWALCNGQLLPISQNTALFSLLGTMYGGDGKSTFALPDLQDSAPLHANNDGDYQQGAPGGSESVQLLLSEIALHNHTLNAAAADAANLTQPAPNRVLARSSGGSAYQRDTTANLTPMAQEAVGFGGSGLPHTNLQPYLVLTFIIALQGVYPPRG